MKHLHVVVLHNVRCRIPLICMYTVCAGVHECVSMSSGAHYYEMEWVSTINL